MSAESTEGAIERLEGAQSREGLSDVERENQLQELQRLAEMLEHGSNSLNQRATTLAALAVAALGAFGAFATRLGDIHLKGMTIATAALLGLASTALLGAALFALRSARPGGQWSEGFAKHAASAIEGPVEPRDQATHLSESIKQQLRRNKFKADRMRHAYESSTFAVIAAALAVLVVAVDATIA